MDYRERVYRNTGAKSALKREVEYRCQALAVLTFDKILWRIFPKCAITPKYQLKSLVMCLKRKIHAKVYNNCVLNRINAEPNLMLGGTGYE